MSDRAEKGALYLSNAHDWETPADLFQSLDGEFGFTLDVCASPENAKCVRYFTEEQDGLSQSWSGEVCWMNPPYGKDVGRWMVKARDSGVTVVCLIPARTDTRWWHNTVENHAEVRFIKGRVKFAGRLGNGHGCPFPSAVVVFRPPSLLQAGARVSDAVDRTKLDRLRRLFNGNTLFVEDREVLEAARQIIFAPSVP